MVRIRQNAKLIVVATLMFVSAFATPALAGRKRAVVVGDEGTKLTVTADAPAVTCSQDGSGAQVTPHTRCCRPARLIRRR